MIADGEDGIGRALSHRLAEETATHLNFATSRNAELPEGTNVNWLPPALGFNQSIYNKKGSSANY